MRWLCGLSLLALAAATGCEKESAMARSTATESPVPLPPRAPTPREALLARAKSLELDTPYVPPPGDPLEHYAAAFAKSVCSAVFISGFSPELAVSSIGFPTCPSEERATLGDPVVDRTARAVDVTLPSGMTRTARYLDSQGCVALPVRQSSVAFTPVPVKSRAANAAEQPWPMGDMLPRDHLYLYTSPDSVAYAATRPLQWPPGRVGRYHNTDPVLVNYLVRIAVEQRGEDYLSFPQRALFDKLGIRTMVLETDAAGNFLAQGYDFMSARDWARLGNLYLDKGVYAGQRLLPESYVRFVSTVAPAWKEDGRPVYGGFFWINGSGQLPVPKDAFYMSGAGEQMTLIVPSHDLVVVRLGHDRGEKEARPGLKRALALLLEAVPRTP